MICIIDYGMGNLRSVQKALEKVGAQVKITSNAKEILDSSKIVLPGVGAIQPAMEQLNRFGLVGIIQSVVAQGRPFLGICLGLQLLFTKSNEGGNVEALNIIPGSVEKFSQLKVPHMGWNQVKVASSSLKMYRDIPNGTNMYFCHSYYVKPNDASVIASTTDYGIGFVSSICFNNIWGVQFHPEKSQKAGLTLLKNFVELV